jgi:hypothetical protein
MYEAVIFPQTHKKCHTLLFDQRPLVVYGKVIDDHGALMVEVGKIEVLVERMADLLWWSITSRMFVKQRSLNLDDS